jgi:hypothetical protein
MEHVMNSEDLMCEPSMDVPENEKFKQGVETLFRDVVSEQVKIEEGASYGAASCESSLAQQGTHDAWVIGAKLPHANAERPILSMGDSLVERLVERENVRQVWSTSRTQQSKLPRHTHFQSDLNDVESSDLMCQMQNIQQFRSKNGTKCPLVVYYVFGNTGGNCELNPQTGKTLNQANIDATRHFLQAADVLGWLADVDVRFVVVSSFHCSPDRTGYNDRLQVKPTTQIYGSEDSESYKKAMVGAQASAGLLEYTSSKFASAALFAAALTKDTALREKLEGQIAWVYDLHQKIDKTPTKAYAQFNEWVLDTLSDEIGHLCDYVDDFYEDTAGSDATLCRPELMSRMQVVKIPFSLTSMIARRAPRVSLKTGVKCLKDTWVRTKGRVGWAISPAAGAAWMETAAARMDIQQQAETCDASAASCHATAQSGFAHALGVFAGLFTDCQTLHRHRSADFALQSEYVSVQPLVVRAVSVGGA